MNNTEINKRNLLSLDEVIHVMNRAMTPEQFVQVVDAILAGKYSWACVLILRFAGYNPLHYIPYRTYNRLMKEHCPAFHRRREDDQSSCDEGRSIQDPTRKITDLSYLDSLDNRQSQARGGTHTCMIYSFIHSL